MITTSLASASSFENMTHLVLKETMFCTHATSTAVAVFGDYTVDYNPIH
jgi:acyl dehydratase